MKIIRSLTVLVLSTGGFIGLFLFFQYQSRATPTKANISIDVSKTTATIPSRWLSLAQGGEEQGVRMLENVVSEVAALYPRYIRIDHIYDYYNVVKRTDQGIIFNFNELDQTVCDIYHTGAQPFFVLGYMPESLSGDTTLVSAPKDCFVFFLIDKLKFISVFNKFCSL